MSPRPLCLASAAVLLTASAWAQADDPLRAGAQRIEQQALVGRRASDTLRQLADGFADRVSGSASHAAAARWAAEQLRLAGLQDVRLEPFPLAHSWARGSASCAIVGPQGRPLSVASFAWAPSTRPGGVRGEVAVLSEIGREWIAAHRADLRGKLVLLDRAVLAGSDKRLIPRLFPAFQALADAGALALILPAGAANNVTGVTAGGWGAELRPLPSVLMGMEDARRVERLLERGPIVLQLDVHNQVGGPVTVPNVIAELPGRSDEWLLVGAHLDAWDRGSGAQDNGAGSAQVLEAARLLAAQPGPLRRGVRFALWAGEEQGLLGSTAWAAAHERELERCVAVLNSDNGAGRPRGWRYQGRDDVRRALAPISKALLDELSAGRLDPAATFDSDHGPFLLRGVPALDLEVDRGGYDPVLHRSGDTFDKVDGMDLKLGAAVLAVTAHALAERPERLAPRLDHDAVGRLLREADLDELVRFLGVWR